MTSWARLLGFRWPRQAGAMVPCSRSSLPTRMTAATSLVDFSGDGVPSHQQSSTPLPPPPRPYAGCRGGQLGLLECELSTIAVSAIIMNPIDITKVGRPSLPGTSPSLSRCRRGSSRDADLYPPLPSSTPSARGGSAGPHSCLVLSHSIRPQAHTRPILDPDPHMHWRTADGASGGKGFSFYNVGFLLWWAL